MSLSVGIVGLPNVGKSTLFNALVARRQAPVGAHPFTTVKPNTGVVRVADPRLEKLSKILKPETTTPAMVTFIDIAGLVKGAHQGEGLGNEFLAQIRGVDAICHVLREFDNPKVAHVMGSVDPTRDRDIVRTELLLKDLETVERARELKPQDATLRGALEKLVSGLNTDRLAREVELHGEERVAVQPLQLLTQKPLFYALNVSESDLEALKEEVRSLAQKLDAVIVSAALEEELTDLSHEERASYRHQVGLRGSGLDRVIGRAYEVLDLIVFYTIKGAGEGRGEVRAWTISRGSTALEAAKRVHTDFAKRFVAAEVIGVEDLLEQGGWKRAKEQGRIRTDGKDSEVKDGEVIEFKIGA